MYALWSNLRARCVNPRHPYYADYGARGITFDPRWDAFDVFLQDVLGAIGLRPGPDWSLDRQRNNEGYRRGNIRWATAEEQANNRRVARNAKLSADAVRKIRSTPGTLKVVADQFGVSPSMVSAIKRGAKHLGVI